MLKKIGKFILIVFIVLLLAIILPFFVGPVIDDIALQKYKSQVLKDLELPLNTEIVETISGCGNTGGTGNHTDLYVAVLLKTTLTHEELNASFDETLYSVSEKGPETWSMGCVGLSFSPFDNLHSYYIMEFIKSAPCSDFDLRGH